MRKREYLGQLELMVLLAVVGPAGEKAYGVSIARDIARSSGRQVALASVYAALERLEMRGFLISSLGDPMVERGGRARTYYRPTPKGVKEAREAHATLMRLGAGLSAPEGEPA
jgi:DNA-binding PadR family transcriptional regulator